MKLDNVQHIWLRKRVELHDFFKNRGEYGTTNRVKEERDGQSNKIMFGIRP
jgi:hypothetical protein